MKPREVLQSLIEGNQRYVHDRLEHPNRSLFRREEIKHQQNPLAIIVGCSDSRVAPEIIFDQGLGDLFTIRVAGNVIGPIERDSIDFAVRYLGASLVLVLGHESCGAVTAVFNGDIKDIEEIAALMQPSLAQAKDIQSAVNANVHAMVRYLRSTPFLKQQMAEEKIEIIGACYHLGKGNVEIFLYQ
ncbi:MAG: carbonic anhydrase [Chlamydiae bacterium RIFCSPHIGHO2_12_FULL_44_59]|nr:MAG: carbonic anhydrase [Chlamydiae bacterium RIFCSPHIGHO2_01_FULL_44_39]OGN61184.1 MAG: carbonic anhydrase [Chlamydiae bacterium RIFCSPHIGHO2_12_FULL_44_59]OGN65654.1 MAG: carbonic anhydrase [Chlamydiae bacterium RIFCSPLOWO2_01_FULL_44_52]OGN68131.1 MAG: carbonic anhydrase [Chlamydiae bacterium RIFCSPLOWO2_02_FULL_45_22]OGN69020.1 MAG: carbonic anhydrase [Chlamydiae bacterium RIFCSPLOWO2_12_FULL_45_20]